MHGRRARWAVGVDFEHPHTFESQHQLGPARAVQPRRLTGSFAAAELLDDLELSEPT